MTDTFSTPNSSLAGPPSPADSTGETPTEVSAAPATPKPAPPAITGAPAAAAPKAAPPWPVASTIGFALMLVSLTTVALISLFTPVQIVTGMPDDPDVAAARELVTNRVAVAGKDLQFVSALGIASGRSGTEPDLVVADRTQRCARAEARLRMAQSRRPNDARLLAALGHLALATDRLETAEHRYRDALRRAASYGEARLGLGMALALRAETTDDPMARTLTLESLAQFAAVPERDPCHGVALANRIVLLRRVGRASEAERLATGKEH